jgi:hypothetical protein
MTATREAAGYQGLLESLTAITLMAERKTATVQGRIMQHRDCLGVALDAGRAKGVRSS